MTTGEIIVTYKQNAKSTSYEVTISSAGKVTITDAESSVTAYYGVTADLGTVRVNETALLKNWKYFYDDENNIYLIYENYLENTTTWSGFASGVQVALAAKGITATVTAKGAPTLEQFAESYKKMYPDDEFNVGLRSVSGSPYSKYLNGSNGDTVYADGYVYKLGDSWNFYQYLENSDDSLFFPNESEIKLSGQTCDTFGYWLARSFC